MKQNNVFIVSSVVIKIYLYKVIEEYFGNITYLFSILKLNKNN